jgi:hypothetical protein
MHISIGNGVLFDILWHKQSVFLDPDPDPAFQHIPEPSLDNDLEQCQVKKKNFKCTSKSSSKTFNAFLIFSKEICLQSRMI